MALHLLERDREGGLALASTMEAALERIGRCQNCRNFAETAQCRICADPSRDDTSLCVVETPADVLALEQATGFRGRYFVLLGRLSPLDGVGPEELGLAELDARLEGVNEMIIAVNPTLEGAATADYLARLARKHAVRVTRIAQGIPLGGELEYVDRSTLEHAFRTRTEAQ